MNDDGIISCFLVWFVFVDSKLEFHFLLLFYPHIVNERYISEHLDGLYCTPLCLHEREFL